MELIFTAVLLALVLLFYFSNRDNSINKWCAYTAFIFWLGIEKEAVLYNIIPALEKLSGNYELSRYFAPAYSVQTWALYSLAMPTAFIYSLNLYGLSKPSRRLRLLVYLPALALSFYFTPLSFRTFQVSGLADGLHSPFWITYSLYNMLLLIAFTYFMIAGALKDKKAAPRRQKTIAVTISLPGVLYWYLTVFPIHTLGIRSQFKLWQGNLIVISLCLGIFIFMSFKHGAMGLKLRNESYHWDSDMALINKGAEYTWHMIKNHAAKMEWSIANLDEWFARYGHEIPEELAILSRSLSAFRDYAGRARKLSEDIVLSDEWCGLSGLIENSLPPNRLGAEINTASLGEFGVLCDRAHMEEVFANIILNALEAVSSLHEAGGGRIDVLLERGQENGFYLIRFADNGPGIGGGELDKIFSPYYTTKSGGHNLGLGLTYCKNVVKKHGGEISAESSPGKGTAITVALPAHRVRPRGEDGA